MKKKDFKYIIKRIIIGVGIFFCIAFIKKCDVKASTLDICYNSDSITCNNNQTYTSFSFNSPYSNNIYNLNNSVDGTLPYIIFYDQNTTSYFVFFIKDSTSSYYDLYDIKLIYDSSGNSYWVGLKCLDEEDEMCENGYAQTSGYQRVFVLSDSNNLDTSSWGGRDITMYNSPIQNEYIYRSSLTGFDSLTVSKKYMYDNFGNFTVYSTNLSSFSIDDNVIVFPSDVSNNLDYIINANYGNNNCNFLISNSDICNFVNDNLVYSNSLSYSEKFFRFKLYNNLSFYNTYSVIFNLKNSDNSYSWAYLLFYTKESINNLVKLDINIDDVTGDITYSFYDINGLIDSNLFFVNSFIIQKSGSSDLDSFISPFNYFEDSNIKISYSYDNFINLKYNLHFFQSFNLYYSDFTFINVNGTSIEEFSRLRSYGIFEDGFINGGGSWADGGIDSNNTESNNLLVLLKIVKRPIDFLTDLTSTSCQRIKATIPFLNTEFFLPCMNSIYKDILGNYYSLVYMVINGLLFYKIGITAAGVVKDIVDPTTDRIAVMDL